MHKSKPKVVAILGSWSCGSTALTGYIARCGANTCPPHQRTNDPRTPDSHEPKALRDALAARINELSLKKIDYSGSAFREWFSEWLIEEAMKCPEPNPVILLKHPLLAYFITDIQAIAQPYWLVITRPLARIEATRKRRGWHPVYGEAGAKVLYGRIFSTLMNQNLSARCVAFDEFQRSPDFRDQLITSLGLQPKADQYAAAETWLTPP